MIKKIADRHLLAESIKSALLPHMQPTKQSSVESAVAWQRTVAPTLKILPSHIKSGLKSVFSQARSTEDLAKTAPQLERIADQYAKDNGWGGWTYNSIHRL